jgi:threonine/homoserine/homoserine lactone efflux protein
MPTATTILLFMTAGLTLNLTPGPDMLFVAAQSTGAGRRVGLASAVGIFLGCLVHIAALGFGLSTLLMRSPPVYQALRWAGACYLVYLGLRAIISPSDLGDSDRVTVPSVRRAVAQGAWTNVLNPKVALFFLAFVPQFVDPARGAPGVQVLVLGMLFNTTGLLVNGGVAWIASSATAWLRRTPGVGKSLQRASGGVFVALGLRLAFQRR